MLRKSAVEEKSGYSIATIYRRVASGLWTKPVRTSAQCSAWPEHEIDVLLAAVVAGASHDDIRKVVARLHIERGAGRQHDQQWRKASRAMRVLAKRSVEKRREAKSKKKLQLIAR
jgi:predicted DNA-binding transcriptional regulator AlpA